MCSARDTLPKASMQDKIQREDNLNRCAVPSSVCKEDNSVKLFIHIRAPCLSTVQLTTGLNQDDITSVRSQGNS